MTHRDRPEYMRDFVRLDHEGMPEAFQDRPSRVLPAFVVPHATSEYARLREAGPRIVEPLRTQRPDQRR